jgi:hypothetical protein
MEYHRRIVNCHQPCRGSRIHAHPNIERPPGGFCRNRAHGPLHPKDTYNLRSSWTIPQFGNDSSPFHLRITTIAIAGVESRIAGLFRYQCSKIPRRSQRRGRTSSRSSAKEKRSPSPIAPISWWALSHSEGKLVLCPQNFYQVRHG